MPYRSALSGLALPIAPEVTLLYTLPNDRFVTTIDFGNHVAKTR
jgi:hypothetical protein